MAVQTVIKKRRDTAANWISVNPVLAAGEEGFETDSGLSKVGNGTDAWIDLDYTSIAVVKEKVKNSTGSTIAKGAVVYISGANGDNALIALADADTELTSSKTLGFVSASIANGAIGTVTTNGILKGVNTGSATAGQSVWLSSTAGGFVFNTPPAKPAHSVYLGVVVRAHSVNGAILVKVQNGYELEELHNVSITNPATGDVLTYDSVSGLWINSEGGTGSASITVSDTAPADPQADSMWFNSAEASAYIYYDSTWVPLSPGIAGPAGPTGIIVSDTAPTNTAQLWADPNAAGSYVVPANGSKGQVLTKITDSSYDTGWTTPQGSGNAIINGAFDIWQRGTSFTANGAYTADRWQNAGGGGGATISRQAFTAGSAPVAGYEGTYFLRYASTSTNIDARLSQPIENVRSFAGQTVTLSFWAKSDVAAALPDISLRQYFGSGGSTSVYAYATSPASLTSSWVRYTYTMTNASIAGKTIGDGNALILYFNFTDNLAFNFDVWGVQVEAGSTATAFKRNSPNLQAELAACQRYYWRTPNNAASNHPLSLWGSAVSGTQVSLTIQYPVQMRIAPSSVFYGGTLQLTDGVNYPTTGALALINASSANAFISVVGNTVQQYRPYLIYRNGDPSAFIAFDAEL